jgi:hypothetical protein
MSIFKIFKCFFGFFSFQIMGKKFKFKKIKSSDSILSSILSSNR